MHVASRKYKISDEDLALLIRTRSKEAAEIMYDTYANLLFLAIIRIVPEREIAEQLLLAAFQEIWWSIDNYVVEEERIYTWMIDIARNLAFEYY